MTISIVTGGAGFIGSHIVEKLKRLDHMVVVVDNEYSDNDNFHWRKDTLNVNIDITDYKALKKAFTGADYIFHFVVRLHINLLIPHNIKTLVLQRYKDTIMSMRLMNHYFIKPVLMEQTNL